MTSLAKNSSYLIIVLLILFTPLFSGAKVFLAPTPSNADIVRSILDVTNNTAIRGALLYGLIGQETAYGSYLGKTESGWQNFCASRNTQDCQNWQRYDCRDAYSNARHFDKILNSIGYARKDVPVSSTCAMGYTQFEPNTWWEVMVKRGESFRDPWLLNDAVLAAALHLKDLGANSSEVLSPGEVIGAKDRIALQKYYCGASYARRECIIYAAGVEAKARQAPVAILGEDLSNQLRQLEEERNRVRQELKLGVLPLTSPTTFPVIKEKREIAIPSKPKSIGTFGNVTAIAADQNFLYLAGETADARWRIEKRNKSDGSHDENFGFDGVVITETDGRQNKSMLVVDAGLAIDEQYMYIAGIVGIFDGQIGRAHV